VSTLTNTETDKLSVMYEGDKERDAAEDGSKVLMAMRAIQASAEKNGLSEMTLDEINAEIAEARR